MHSILIVDDEDGIRQILTRWLESPLQTVRVAPDAESALAAMAESAAGVVLCDVEMPGQGGLWLTAQLRERFPHTAIILATGVDSVSPATSLQSGIIDYLVKPFQRERVLRSVSSALAWHAASLAKPPAPAGAVSRVDAWMDAGEKDG